MVKFRFQNLEIWQLSIEIAGELDNSRLYRFAEQLRGAAMSVSNNIAEGSGSTSSKEFGNFLNMARRSAFENANILLLLKEEETISQQTSDSLLEDLDHLCRKITSFQKNAPLVSVYHAIQSATLFALSACEVISDRYNNQS